MAEENKQDPAINTVKEQVEALDLNGNTLPRSGGLADIFEKMEQGATVDEAAKAVSSPAKKPDKEEPKPAVKAEVVPSELDKKLDEKEKAKEDEGEVSRSKLLEQTKLKEEKPEAELKDEALKAEDDIPEDELKVLPHDKPKTAKRIQALLKKIESVTSESTKTKQEAQEKATKLADLEKRLGEQTTVDPKTAATIKQQQDELAMFRRRYDLEKDPEVKSRFDDRIASAETPISELLTRNGAGEPLLKIIKEEGGWLKFTQSLRPVTLRDGVKPAAEVADLILQNLPFADRRQLEAIATEQVATKREKERYFEEQQKTATDYFKKQEDERNKQSEGYKKQVEDTKKLIEDWQKEVKVKNGWLQEKEIPADAPAEQKAAIEDDNKYTRQLNQLLKKAIETKDVQGMLDVVLDSVQFYQERRAHSKTMGELASIKKENLRLQQELDKVKQGRTIPKAGSIQGGGASGGPVKKKKAENIEEAFSMLEAGANPAGGDDDE